MELTAAAAHTSVKLCQVTTGAWLRSTWTSTTTNTTNHPVPSTCHVLTGLRCHGTVERQRLRINYAMFSLLPLKICARARTHVTVNRIFGSHDQVAKWRWTATHSLLHLCIWQKMEKRINVYCIPSFKMFMCLYSLQNMHTMTRYFSLLKIVFKKRQGKNYAIELEGIKKTKVHLYDCSMLAISL